MVLLELRSRAVEVDKFVEGKPSHGNKGLLFDLALEVVVGELDLELLLNRDLDEANSFSVLRYLFCLH